MCRLYWAACLGVTSAALHQLNMKAINVVTILEDGLDEKYSLL